MSGGGEGGSEWRLSCDRRRNLEHPEGLGERRVFKQGSALIRPDPTKENCNKVNNEGEKERERKGGGGGGGEAAWNIAEIQQILIE